MKHESPRPFPRLKDLFGLERKSLVLWAVLLGLLLAGAAYLSFHFAPPTTITISSGPEGSIFQRNAEKYRAILAHSGITLKIVPSEGSLQNLQRLNEPKGKVDVAFVQGGLTNGQEYPRLMSLGSVSYEPLRIFYRNAAPITLLSELSGKRIVVGPEGSGTYVLALALLKLNGIEPGGATTLLTLDAEEGAKSLLDGSADAIFLMGDSASTQITRDLSKDATVQVYDFVQADAYVRRIHYLNKLVMPKGAADFGKGLPPHDIELVGPTVELIARADLHPAITDLLLECARQVHGGVGPYQRQGEFPALVEHEFHISDEAVRYFKSGKTFLYRDLPFWLANIVNRLLLVVVPSLVVLIPCVKIIPSLYQWRVRLRLYRWYTDLLTIEGDLLRDPSAHRPELLKRIDQIEERVNQYKVPASFADQFYALRGHLLFVRERLAKDA